MRKVKRNKLVCGVGINDADYNVYRYELVEGKWKSVWTCPYYEKWHSMLKRTYSAKVIKKRPTYARCSVVAPWFYFSNFKSWMEIQDWEGKHLDKDILVVGNTLYSPELCVFVSAQVNSFITEGTAARGEYPIGVCFHKASGKFSAYCGDLVSGNRKHLGLFNNTEEAHLSWLAFKLKQAYILAEEQTDERVAQALIERYKNYSYV